MAGNYEITQELLLQCFDYCSLSGTLICVKKPSKRSRLRVGRIAGSLHKYRKVYYRSVCIDGVRYNNSTLIWLYKNGTRPLPGMVLDHINHNPSDGRIENLREVPAEENARNYAMKSANKSGVTGVYRNKNLDKWHAQICFKRKKIHLGYFDSLEAAAEARESAKLALGFHANHGLGGVS